MQTTVTNGEITTVFDVAEFNVNVGESARIDVNEAVNYIKTGQAEVQETVDEGIADFNQNAVEKTNTFNSNATSKTTAFNENASAKTADFNSNASAKTGDFNSNATNKTTVFNNNASEKTTAFNDNYTEKKAIIDGQVDLAKDWATKTDGTVDGEDYSAKYYAQSILPYASDITTVAGIASDVTAVSSNNTDISAVADDLTNINSVAGISTEVSTVAGNASNINTVAGISSDVSTVAGISSDVTAVKNNATDISTVATNISDVSSVATDISNVNAVANDLTNIDAVNSNKTNIDAVAGDLTNINAVAGDLTNINNASTYADNANIWAEGTDEEVEALGGVHSSKGWAEVSSQGQVQSNWAETDTTAKSYIQNKPTLGTMAAESASDYTKTSGLATVATSGNYNDLSNKPTIPTVTDTYSATSSDGMSGKAVASAISGKANDSDVVKLAGNQTISGNKTFTGYSTLARLTLSAEIPSGYEGGEIWFSGGSQEPNGSNIMKFDRYKGAFRFSGADSNGTTRIPLTVDIENNTATGVTPATSDNSTKIATTAFVKSNLSSKQDIATAVNYDNITNCITEIPQDIKLELNNGTLTLKAGSKVYVPNGVGVFDAVTVPSDIVFHSGTIGTGTDNLVLCCNLTGDYGIRANPEFFDSGATAPTNTNHIWYDTTNNMIKAYENGSWVQKYSLPIGIYHRENGNAVSINQVFNGFGYIGSTVFALPGVKGLIPNGRNEDGSLKSVEYNRTSVRVDTFSISLYTGPFNLYCFQLFSAFQATNYYDEKTNTMLNNYNGSFISGDGYLTNGKITSLTPKTAFHALDYNDFSDLKDEVATDLNGKADVDLSNCTKPHIVETYSNGSSWYRVYSDGWCEQGGVFNTSTAPYTVIFLKPFRDTNYQIFKNIQLNTNSSLDVRGTMFFNLTATSAQTYTWSANENWQACGYIN